MHQRIIVMNEKKNQIEITDFVKNISDSISLDENFDVKEDYIQYLIRKYS